MKSTDLHRGGEPGGRCRPRDEPRGRVPVGGRPSAPHRGAPSGAATGTRVGSRTWCAGPRRCPTQPAAAWSPTRCTSMP